MQASELKWVDSDMHISEPVDLWKDYIDPKYKEWMPRWLGEPGKDNPQRDRIFFQVGPNVPKYTDSDRENPDEKIRASRYPIFEPYMTPDRMQVDPQGQLKAMGTEKIDIAVLFPTWGATAWQDPAVPPDAALAIARAYNSWLHDFCKSDPGRLKVNALITIMDIDGAVEEIRRAVKDLGAVSVWPGCSRADVRLDDPKWEPIWAEAERHNVTVSLHGSRQIHLRARYADSAFLSKLSGRGIEHAVSLMELMTGGVMERHPKLRFAFLETGCTWVLYWLFRVQQEWERFSKEMPRLAENMKRPPIEYWKRQCWSAVDPDEWTLSAVISLVGDENWVVSSDFPHFDSPFPEARQRFMSIPNVSVESKKKILWDNCCRLYNLAC